MATQQTTSDRESIVIPKDRQLPPAPAEYCEFSSSEHDTDRCAAAECLVLQIGAIADTASMIAGGEHQTRGDVTDWLAPYLKPEGRS